MTSFMGPMAPPPPAQPQPQAMDFQTDPNNRQRFRQFLNNRMQPPMMQQPAMMQAPAHMPPILPEVDIFEPQGYADGGIVGFSNGGSTQPIEQRVMKNGQIGLFRGQTFLGFKQEPEKKPIDIGFGGDRKILERIKNFIGLEDGGAVPPRRADIRGQDHMLSYITPDEADILKALGGSGEAGPMGIPTYDDIDESYGIDSFDDFGSGMDEGQDSVTADTYSGGGYPSGGGSDDFDADLADTTGAIEGVDFNVDDGDSGGVETPRSNINRVPTETTELLNIFSDDARSGQLRDDELGGMPSQYTEIPDMAMGTPNPNVNMFDDFDETVGSIASVNTGRKSSQEDPSLLGLEDEYLDEDIAAGFGQYDGRSGGPGRSGLGTFSDRQQRAQDYAKEMGYDLTDRSMYKEGAERGFSGITQEQLDELEDRAAGSIFGDTFMNTPKNILDEINAKRATGIYTKPDGTVRGVTSLPDPEAFGGLMQKGVNFLGGFMPNFIGETYTGTGPNPFDGGRDPGGDGGDDQPVKPKVDPCPPGFSLVNGTCTPVSNSGGGSLDMGEIGTGQPPPPPAPVIVPSSRQSMPFVGTMPSGYGTPMTGGVNPQVMSEMQKYAQLLSRPQSQYPVGLANGGSVSSNLDMAADNFLKALMPAA
jgi:hypothetical protein